MGVTSIIRLLVVSVNRLPADTRRLTDHVSQDSYICEFCAKEAVLIRPLFCSDVAQPSLGDGGKTLRSM